MSPSSLIRTVRFRAHHHYRRRDWSEEQNRRAFGAYLEPHEHEFVVEVEVGGPLDPEKGFLVDLDELDRQMEGVIGPLRGADLNAVIAGVRTGAMQPSTEALARWLFESLQSRIPAPARLQRVRVSESDALASEYRASSA